MTDFCDHPPVDRVTMTHRESPLDQWKDLGTWLDVVTSDFLPSQADLTRSKGADQLEEDIDTDKSVPAPADTPSNEAEAPAAAPPPALLEAPAAAPPLAPPEAPVPPVPPPTAPKVPAPPTPPAPPVPKVPAQPLLKVPIPTLPDPRTPVLVPVKVPECVTIAPPPLMEDEEELKWDPSRISLAAPSDFSRELTLLPSPQRGGSRADPRLSVSRKRRGHRCRGWAPSAQPPGLPSLVLAGARGAPVSPPAPVQQSPMGPPPRAH
nr:proline-rich protein 36-like isoform X1 [Paramormyrops kingsleyae]